MRAVVLVSGGMDSLVTAAAAVAAGRECAFLHVTYGQRTAERERRAFEAIADYYQPYKRLVADIGYLAAIGGSALTDPNIPVPVSPLPPGEGQGEGDSVEARRACGETSASHRHEPRPSGSIESLSRTAAPISPRPPGEGQGEGDSVRAPAAVPVTYVPFRNAHLIAIATSLAEVEGACEIYIGATQVDYSGYPDCRREFFDALEKAVNLGTKPETRIRIVTPVINMTKAGIVRQGLKLTVPFELSWSCYVNSGIACGKCESCVLRLKGFAEAGARDPIPYEAQ